MADVKIEDVTGSGFNPITQRHVVSHHSDPKILWAFYLNPTGIVVSKSLDGGGTWAPSTLIDGTTSVADVSIWADWWTPGITGDEIHLLFIRFDSGAIWYRSFNILTDVVSSNVQLAFGTGGGALWIGITKAKSGRLAALSNESSPANKNFLTSDDGGGSWTSRAVPAGGDFDFVNAIAPANTANDNDVMIVTAGVLNDVFLWEYDTSGDTWPKTLLISKVVLDPHYIELVPMHSDGGLRLVIRDGLDMRFWNVVNRGSVTERTSFIATGGNTFVRTHLTIDQSTNNIYVTYSSGPTSPTRKLVYRLSTDDMVTWQSEIEFSEDVYAISDTGGPYSIGSPSGRFLPIWRGVEVGVLTWWTNSGSSFPVGPPLAIPRVVLANAGEFTAYISPDKIVYPFHTPHNLGRWIISESGWGTPPINYVTQRGPFQHGVTVKDFFLQPRVIQLLIRQGFCDREELWAGRAGLLDEIRPNRQAISTATVPGELRRSFSDGRVRSLEVFIAEGPRFEPQQVNIWDEFAFQEVLRFIAHNPIVFDPRRNDVNFIVDLDSQLVFPITFPIQFGSGEVDDILNINYVGTWESLPIIVITGPIERPRINNVTTGEKLQFSIDISPGQIVTIDLSYGSKTVIDDTGANLIGGLTADSDLATFHIAPTPEAPLGVNTMRLRGQHATRATDVEIRYFDRFFGI